MRHFKQLFEKFVMVAESTGRNHLRGMAALHNLFDAAGFKYAAFFDDDDPVAYFGQLGQDMGAD